MSTFLQSMKNAVAKAAGHAPPWGDVNPLVTIGLTEAVLDLELNEEQMFRAVRGFTRQLAAQVHPDRQPENVSAERQRAILRALDYLDDQERFALALHDFRTIKAEERREIRIMASTVSALRAQAETVDKKEQLLRAERDSLTSQQNAFRKQRADEVLQVPILRNQLAKTEQELKRTEQFLSSERSAHKEWLRRFRSLELYFTNLGVRVRPHAAPFAFELKWLALAFLSFDANAKKMTPIDATGNIRDEFLAAARSARIPKQKAQRIAEGWGSVVARFGKTNEVEGRILRLTLCLAKKTSQGMQVVFGDAHAMPNARIIGSLPPIEGSPFTRQDLTSSQGRQKIMERCLPLIFPGGILVSVVQQKKTIKWNMYDPALFHTRRIILAAG